jgi:hypothetical protein
MTFVPKKKHDTLTTTKKIGYFFGFSLTQKRKLYIEGEV